MSLELSSTEVARLRRKRVLFAYPRHFSTFIERDWKLISRAFPESELFCVSGFGSFWRLRAAIRRADLIFCWFGGRNALAAALLNRPHRPMIVVAGGYEVANVPELRYGSFSSPFQARLAQWMFAHTDMVLAVSDFTAQCAATIAGITPKRIRTIYHGFDSLAWTPVEQPREIDVLTISNEDYMRKSMDLVLGCARQLSDLRFLIVGKISDEHLRRVIGQPLPDNIELMGTTFGDELKTLLSKTRVYLQPSRHESFGCAVAEAMLMGCIPVVARATAQPEVVGDAGFYAEPLTEDGVVAAVNAALAAPEEMRLKARERIVTRFALDDYAKNLITIIEETLAEHEMQRGVA